MKKGIFTLAAIGVAISAGVYIISDKVDGYSNGDITNKLKTESDLLSDRRNDAVEISSSSQESLSAEKLSIIETVDRFEPKLKNSSDNLDLYVFAKAVETTKNKFNGDVLSEEEFLNFKNYVQTFDLDAALKKAEIDSNIKKEVKEKYQLLVDSLESKAKFGSLVNAYSSEVERQSPQRNSLNLWTIQRSPKQELSLSLDSNVHEGMLAASNPISSYKDLPLKQRPHVFTKAYAQHDKTSINNDEVAKPAPIKADPSIQQCSYTAADLSIDENDAGTATSDTRLFLNGLAKKLNYDPLKIYKFVKEEVDFEYYNGRVKNLKSVVLTKKGNDIDQAVLLAELLRIAKIPTRYVSGYVHLDVRDIRIRNWLNIKSAFGLKDLLASVDARYYNNFNLSDKIRASKPFLLDNGDESVISRFVWVESCVPTSNYRDIGADVNSGGMWHSLMPSFNEVEIKEGSVVTNLFEFDYDKYIKNSSKLKVYDEILNQVSNFNGGQALISKRVPLKKNMDFLPMSLPLKVYPQSYTKFENGFYTTKIPDSWRFKVKYSLDNSSSKSPYVAKKFSITKLLSDVSDKPVSFWFDGDSSFRLALKHENPENCRSNTNVSLKFQVADELKTVAGFQSCNILKFKQELMVDGKVVGDNGFSKLNTYSKYSPIIGSGQSSSTSLEQYKNKINYDYLRSIANEQNLPEKYFLPSSTETQNFLSLAGHSWTLGVENYASNIASFYNANFRLAFKMGLVSTLNNMQYFLGTPLGVTGQRFLLDMPGGYIQISGKYREVDKYEISNLYSFTASAYESYIWQELALLDAISTVKGLQIASAKDIPVWFVDDFSNPPPGSFTDYVVNGKYNSQVIDLFVETYGVNCKSGEKLTKTDVKSIFDTIKSAVYNKKIVRGYFKVPLCRISYNGWLGYVFDIVAENSTGYQYVNKPIAGSSSYMAHGGYSVGPPVNLNQYTSYGGYGYNSAVTYEPSVYDIFSADSTPNTVTDQTYFMAPESETGNGTSTGLTAHSIYAGDPVNTFSGNFFTKKTDVFLPTNGSQKITFTRFYNSFVNTVSNIGLGWTHNYNHKLKLLDTTGDKKVDKIVWIDDTFATHYFSVPASYDLSKVVNFKPSSGLQYKLYKSGGYFYLKDQAGNTLKFKYSSFTPSKEFSLVSIHKKGGNAISLSYVSGLLDKVYSGSSYLKFTYQKCGSKKIVNKIITSDSRVYTYKCMSENNLGFLSSVILHGDVYPREEYVYGRFRGQDKYALKEIKKRNKGVFSLSYYANGKVAAHKDQNGKVFSFNYNSFARETTTVDEVGNKEIYRFNENGMLISKVDAEGGFEQYFYTDSRHPLVETKRIKKNGFVYQYTYDDRGRLLTKKFPNNKVESYSSYTSLSQPKVIKHASGKTSVIDYDGSGRPRYKILLKPRSPVTGFNNSHILSKTVFTYLSNGNLSKVQQIKDLGNNTGPYYEYGYNSSGLVTSVKRCGYQYNDALVLKTQCFTFKNAYDEQGNLLTGFDDRYYPVKKEYLPSGQVSSLQDAFGNSTFYDYDSQGALTSAVLRGLDNQGFLSTLYSESYQYDNMGRVVSSNTSMGENLTYEYNGVGQLLKAYDTLGQSVAYEYDSLGRVLSQYDHRGYKTRYSYNTKGDLINIDLPGGVRKSFTYFGASRLGGLASESISNIKTLYSRDQLGRVIRIADPYGSTESIHYNSLGKVSLRVFEAENTTDGDNIRESLKYFYNNLGFLVRIENGFYQLGVYTKTRDLVTYIYDDYGHVLTETDYSGVITYYKYDKHFNVVSVSKNDGSSVTYQYNHQRGGVLSKVTYKSPGKTTETVSYSYDALGRVQTQTNHRGDYITYSYDSTGNIKGQYQSLNDVSFEYRYDAYQRLVYVGDNKGNREEYQYDSQGNLVYIKANEAAVGFAYDARGQLTNKFFNNGLSASYLYTNLGLLQNASYQKNNQTLSQTVYTYDKTRKTREVVTSPAGLFPSYANSYTYDKLNRLTSVEYTNKPNERFEYDTFGNISKVTYPDNSGNDLLYVYDNTFDGHVGAGRLSAIKRLQNGQAGATLDTFQYDALGRVTSRSGRQNYTLGYDARGLVSTVHQGNSLVEQNTYDVLGRRTSVLNGAGVQQKFTYLGNNPWTQSQGSLVTKSLYSSLDALEATSAGSNITYHFQNDLQSITGKLSGTNDEYTHQGSYTAWGVNSAVSQGVGYTGREANTVGLYYYRNRYYDPSIGRFLQQDPAGFVDGFNRYSYVKNNPVNFIDPYGLFVAPPSIMNAAEYLVDDMIANRSPDQLYPDRSTTINYMVKRLLLEDVHSNVDKPWYSAFNEEVLVNSYISQLDRDFSCAVTCGLEPVSIENLNPVSGAVKGVLTKGATAFFVKRAANGLSKQLKNKMKHIKNQTAAGGDRGISGSVSSDDALRLGKEFVGPGFRIMSSGKGYVSADGLRTFRFPSNKRGINSVTGEPWSRTGRQVNFETKPAPGETPTSNVHLDVN
jgi:RHS repeat-associated protein